MATGFFNVDFIDLDFRMLLDSDLKVETENGESKLLNERNGKLGSSTFSGIVVFRF